MPPQAPDDFVELLEAVAIRFYTGLYVLVDEAADDLLGEPDLRAHLIAGISPDFKPTSVRAIGLVRPSPMGSRALPAEWRQILECARRKPWKVDLFVHMRDVSRVQRLAKDMNPRAHAVPLPQLNARSLFARAVLRAASAR